MFRIYSEGEDDASSQIKYFRDFILINKFLGTTKITLWDFVIEFI